MSKISNNLQICEISIIKYHSFLHFLRFCHRYLLHFFIHHWLFKTFRYISVYWTFSKISEFSCFLLFVNFGHLQHSQILSRAIVSMLVIFDFFCIFCLLRNIGKVFDRRRLLWHFLCILKSFWQENYWKLPS